MPEILRAARALPMTPGWPLLEDAAVVVHDQVILDLGSFAHMRRKHDGPVRDLGDVTLAPATFNSHTHLEMTHLLGRTQSGQGFVPWIQSLLAENLYALDEVLVRQELARLESRGCAFVADISTRNAPRLAEILAASGLFFTSFNEVIGQEAIGSAPPASDLPSALLHQVQDVEDSGRGACAMAGHALYSTSPELLRAAKAANTARGLPFSLHLAEHADEDAILLDGQGAFLDLLRERGFITDYTAPGKRPAPLAAELGLLDQGTLCVHCVTLTEADIALIAGSGASVCLCPRSNEYIGVGQAPLAAFLAAGVNLCLGTDGLCSNVDLDPYAELAWLAAQRRSALSLGQGLAFITVNPARFFGLQDRLGSLAPGRLARFSVLPQAVLDAFSDGL